MGPSHKRAPRGGLHVAAVPLVIAMIVAIATARREEPTSLAAAAASDFPDLIAGYRPRSHPGGPRDFASKRGPVS